MTDFVPEETRGGVYAEYEGRKIHASIYFADPGPGQRAEWQVDTVFWIEAPLGRRFYADAYLNKCSPKQRQGFLSALDRAL